MKTLPTEFTYDGFAFTQLERHGLVALFRKRKARPHGYEVAMVQIHAGFEIAGRHVEAGEAMPPTSQWGIHGWTFLEGEYPRALARFRELCAGLERPAVSPPKPHDAL